MKTKVDCPDCYLEQEVEEMLIEKSPTTIRGLRFSLKLKCGHEVKLYS